MRSLARASVRNRCYSIGILEGSLLPIAADIEVLQVASRTPIHHIDSILCSPAASLVGPEDEPGGGARLASAEASDAKEYASFFEKGLCQAIASKKIDKDFRFKALSERMSAHLSGAPGVSNWLLAQIDLHRACNVFVLSLA